MTDNITLDPGSGGSTVATDDDGTAHHQYVKLEAGADGTQTKILAGGGVEAAALRVTVASDSTGVLSVDDNGATLSVDDGGGALTVDGTVAVSGTVTVDLSTNNDVTVTSGAITETNSGAIKTSVELIDDAVYTDGTGTPSKGLAVMGTDGTNPQIVSTNASGHVNIADGGNTITVDGTVAATQSGTWTVQPGNTANTTAWKVDGSAVTQPVSNTVLSVVGTGTEAAAQRVTIATDSTGVLSVDDNGASLTVDYATTGSGTATGALRVELPTNGTGVLATVGAVTAITNALPAGPNAIGKLAANSGVDIGDVDVTSIAAGANAIGNIGVIPRTSGGLSIFRSLDLDETEEDVKTSAGQMFGWYIFNAAASTRYVKFYNATAANVTVGSTTPVLTIPVPAGAAANVFSEIGIAFGTAISAAATTGVADADTGAPSANDVVINVFYA